MWQGEHLNSTHPNNAFKKEIEKKHALQFLDVLTTKNKIRQEDSTT